MPIAGTEPVITSPPPCFLFSQVTWLWVHR